MYVFYENVIYIYILTVNLHTKFVSHLMAMLSFIRSYLRLGYLVADRLQELDHFQYADVSIVVDINRSKYLLQ